MLHYEMEENLKITLEVFFYTIQMCESESLGIEFVLDKTNLPKVFAIKD